LEFFEALGALAFQTGLAHTQPAHAILAETAQSALKARHGANSRFVMLKFQISNPNQEPTTLTKFSGYFRIWELRLCFPSLAACLAEPVFRPGSGFLLLFAHQGFSQA